MTWTKLSDRFTDDPVLLDLPRGTRLLFVEGLVWCNRVGTNGRISSRMLARFTDEPDPEKAAQTLVDAGKWQIADDGWEVVDFLSDQMRAEDVERMRLRNQERTRRWRAHRDGYHHLCSPERCDAARDAARDGAPPVTPDPPARKGKGQGVSSGNGARLGEPAPAAEDENHVACLDYQRHQSRHRRSGKGWVCDLCTRRNLARLIRESAGHPNQDRYRRIFAKSYGDLYGRSAA